MKFALRWPFVTDSQQQANNEDLLGAINQIAQFVFFGDGAPTFTPDGPAIYFRQDFGNDTAFYIYDGAWKAVATP